MNNKDFFDAYSEAVLIISDKQELVYVNPAFTFLTGYVTHDLPGTLLHQLTSQIDGDSVDRPLNYKHLQVATKDGQLLRLRVSISEIVVSGSAKGACFTLSPLVSVERPELDENKFYQLADASPAMIFIEDKKGQAFYFNLAWLEYTGKPASELENLQWKSLVNSEDLKQLEDIKPEIAARQNYMCEYRLQKYDGSYRNIFAIGTPIHSAEGQFEGYMTSCLDITEVKEAQTKISQLSHELNLAKEELDQFTYVTSHDLQEPLRTITGYVQLIQKNIEKGNLGAINEFMEFVLSGTTRMQGLIADLLKLSRVTRKAAPFAPVEVQEVITVALAHLDKKVKATHAKISYGPMPLVMGDSFQLVSLFENLLDNALKFISLSATPEISISATEKEGYYIFEVKDNGIGIDNKFHKRIFAIFQRLHTRAEYEGTGIGLAVCKKIIERHGGEIWVESEPGNGSTFYFTIKKQ
jgi:PAS domain S-box-containing protein